MSEWYEKTAHYWANVPPTIDGVLGGMEHVHDADIRESKAFLESLASVGRERALDCGAGIGRFSKYLLCPLFRTTDLIERSEQLVAAAKADLPVDRVGEFLVTSLEQAVLPHTYDLIAMPWVAAYLKDDDLVSFLSRCKAALKPNGIIFIKDNVVSGNDRFEDDEDNSQIRSERQYKIIFAGGGVTCVKQRSQRDWPKDLYPARMYALR